MKRARPAAAAIVMIVILLPLSLPAQGLLPVVRGVGRALPEGGVLPRAHPPEQGSYSVPSGYYYYFAVYSHGPGTKLKFTVTATAAVDVYVMTATQFAGYENFGSKAAIYQTTASSLAQSVPISAKGTYYLVVDNDISGASVFMDVAYSTVPVDLYQLHTSPPAPTGTVDYGVDNASGYLTPYKETLSEVTGTGILTDVVAFNSTSPTGASPYGASLQLNEMLRVNTTLGQHVYWLQNVLSLYTNNDTAYFLNNVWNASVPDGLLDQSLISGSGSVYPEAQRNYYAYAGNVFSFTYPIAARLPVVVSYAGDRVLIAFGYEENHGVFPSGATTFFDNVTVTEPASVTDAAMVVSGYEMTPNQVYYDSELVFGGQCCSAITTFTSMNSSLSMSYRSTNGDVLTPRDVYQFGSDTAEGAYGIRTSLGQNKFVVSLGALDFASGFTIAPPLPIPITLSYTVSDGSQLPGPPVLQYTANGSEVTSVLSGSSISFRADGGTQWTVTASIRGAGGERWATSSNSNGTAETSQTLAITYYHQYMLNASYSVNGGGTPSPPVLQTTAFGGSYRVALGANESGHWVDSGSAWALPASLGGSSGSHRWEASTSVSGTANGPLVVAPVYFEQYLLTIDYQVVGGGIAGDFPLNFTSLGVRSSTGVSQQATSVWVDGASGYQAGSLTTASGSGERWVSNSTLRGFVSAPVSVTLVYYHQFLLSTGASASQGVTVLPQSGWFDSGKTVAISSGVTSLWRFSGWTGSGQGSYSGAANSTSVEMEGPINETATFDPGVRLVSGQGGSVSYVLGATTGTVGPGESVVVYAPAGTRLILAAQPSLLQTLSEWTGSVNGSESTASFALQSPSQVSATFGIDFLQVGGIAIGGLAVLAVIYAAVRRRGRTRV